MVISKALKVFIEDNMHLIKDGDFEKLYRKALTAAVALGNLHRVLIAAGISYNLFNNTYKKDIREQLSEMTNNKLTSFAEEQSINTDHYYWRTEGTEAVFIGNLEDSTEAYQWNRSGFIDYLYSLLIDRLSNRVTEGFTLRELLINKIDWTCDKQALAVLKGDN